MSEQDKYDERASVVVGEWFNNPSGSYPTLLEAVAAALRAQYEVANGQLTADLMGCRDGALVRDLRAEIAQLKAQLAELQRGYTATGVESWPCPGCEWERGNWIKKCGLHEQIDNLDDKLAEAEKRGMEKAANLAEGASLPISWGDGSPAEFNAIQRTRNGIATAIRAAMSQPDGEGRKT